MLFKGQEFSTFIPISVYLLTSVKLKANPTSPWTRPGWKGRLKKARSGDVRVFIERVQSFGFLHFNKSRCNPTKEPRSNSDNSYRRPRDACSLDRSDPFDWNSCEEKTRQDFEARVGGSFGIIDDRSPCQWNSTSFIYGLRLTTLGGWKCPASDYPDGLDIVGQDYSNFDSIWPLRSSSFIRWQWILLNTN